MISNQSILSSIFLAISFFSYSQKDTISIEQLEVLSPLLSLTSIPADNVIVGRDYIFLQNYEPENTLFYYQNEVFTGVAKYDDSSRLTFISFLDGKIHGRWYDETIWNDHLTFEGQYVNGYKYGIWRESSDHRTFEGQYVKGFKNGIWRKSSDGKLFRTENYLNDTLQGKQVTYVDYFSDDRYLYELNGVKINSTAYIESNFVDGNLTEESYVFSDGTFLNGELIYKQLENGDTLKVRHEFFVKGKFTGEISYCYNNNSLISTEFHLLENGLVEKKEIDCETGMISDQGLFKPKKVFSSMLYFGSEEDFERQ
jgi:hypothetical protein